MIRICPSCGYRTADDQSLFCNKCGYPFPKEEPAPARAPPAPPAYPPGRQQPPARTAGKQPRQKKTVRSGRPPFKRFIARKIRLIYWLGAIAIILVSLLGISAGFSTTGTDAANLSFTNTTALVQTPSASPLFWIGFLIIGSLLWRIFCELVAAVFRIYDALEESGDVQPEEEAEEGGGWAEGMVRCSRCGEVVSPDQLRECEHCGVQGCSNCIRKMGLVRKTLTCRECFENK
jgi:Domain of unknown function (DUF4282)